MLHVRLFALSLLLLAPSLASAETIVLKSGMRFDGTVGKLAGIANPVLSPSGANNNPTGVKPVILIDDGLRRIFVPALQVAAIPADAPARFETFRIPQRVAETGFQVNTVGPALRVEQFDDWGRRLYTMSGAKGPLDVVQGITEVTPNYIRVQGLLATTSYVWDMRIATSSLPRETLSRVLKKSLDATKPGERQRIVILYVQADRIQDARLELEELVKEFPHLASLKEQVDTLRQLSAQRLMKEIKQRREAGQHRLAYAMAAEFPVEGIADATVIGIRELNVEYEDQHKLYTTTLQTLNKHWEAIADKSLREQLQPYCLEIAHDLNVNTLDRLADFNRLADDEKLTDDQKVALAVSGWMMGSGSGLENTPVAVSVARTRDAIRSYLSKARKPDRDDVLKQMKTEEGSSLAYVAKIVANMKPPRDPTRPVNEQGEARPANEKSPGLYELSCPGVGTDKEFKYLVQLPPEYDPYRKYPCVVTMHEAGSTAELALDWWAGAYSEQAKTRVGQATRQGYIVISPRWTRDHQRQYEYSVREHAAVIFPLRDALQQFAIDSDRVYLSGHGMGGDAAWDIGISHPDLWAGVIPITANADKFVNLYPENARLVPWYFVVGEKDGSRKEENGVQWDRYLSRANYDVQIVEYQGRGHDHFYDDIQHMFTWMQLHRRNFAPREFKTTSLRATDNFFWWVELTSIPANQNVSPLTWPPPKNTPPLVVESEVQANNSLRVKTGSRVGGYVYLSPEQLDFEKKLIVTVNADRKTAPAPSLEVLLEDVRTRGDRQHPFWIRLEF